jgi:hypothetical protein
MAKSMSPRRSAISTSGEVRKETHWKSMAAVDFSIMADRCWVLPAVTVPTLSLPGLSRATWITSANER